MLPTPQYSYNDHVYEPAEDSFLLLDTLEEQKTFLEARFSHKIPVVCEVGTGSGIVVSFICKHILPRSLCVATDINPHACATAQETVKANGAKVDLLQMSLAAALVPGTTDVMVFNPPYVPAETVPARPSTAEDATWLDLALLGGEKGMAVTNELLEGLETTLSKDGVAYVLFCARNDPERVVEEWRGRGWCVDVVMSRKAAWEVLSIVRFKRNN